MRRRSRALTTETLQRPRLRRKLGVARRIGRALDGLSALIVLTPEQRSASEGLSQTARTARRKQRQAGRRVDVRRDAGPTRGGGGDVNERENKLRTLVFAALVGASVAWAAMVVAFAFDPSRWRL